MNQQRTTAGDDRKSVAVAGTCVLLHAAGSSPRALSRLSSQLEAVGWRCTAPALQMTVDPGDRPLAAHIRSVRDVLAAAGPGPKVLFGHSFGGLVALLALLDGVTVDLAVLYEPITLAVLDDTDLRDREARAWDRALVDHLDASHSAGQPEAGVSRFIEAYNEVKWSELPATAKAQIITDATAIRDLTRVVHHLDIDRARLAKLNRRVLLMSGTRSPSVTQRMVARLAELLPNAAQSSLRDAGHMAPVMKPAVVAELMLPFIAECRSL